MTRRTLALVRDALAVLLFISLVAGVAIALMVLFGCGTTRTQTANHHPRTATVSVTVDVAVPVCPGDHAENPAPAAE